MWEKNLKTSPPKNSLQEILSTFWSRVEDKKHGFAISSWFSRLIPASDYQCHDDKNVWSEILLPPQKVRSCFPGATIKYRLILWFPTVWNLHDILSNFRYFKIRSRTVRELFPFQVFQSFQFYLRRCLGCYHVLTPLLTVATVLMFLLGSSASFSHQYLTRIVSF